nr:MAG TPA: hypothetical protein [Caudoviricetes sp.]
MSISYRFFWITLLLQDVSKNQRCRVKPVSF